MKEGQTASSGIEERGTGTGNVWIVEQAIENDHDVDTYG